MSELSVCVYNPRSKLVTRDVFEAVVDVVGNVVGGDVGTDVDVGDGDGDAVDTVTDDGVNVDDVLLVR